jgi:AcrR family transcriptional regulator
MSRRISRDARAEAIARAALPLFAELGVRGASTRAIARRAQTTEGNLYRYFPSKQEIARRVLSGCLTGFGEFIARALDGVAGPRARLRAFVRAYLDFARQRPMEHTLVVEAHHREIATLPEDMLRPRRILMDILSDGMGSGDFERADPRLLAPFIAGGLARTALAVAARHPEATPEEVARELADTVERLVGASRALRGDDAFREGGSVA